MAGTNQSFDAKDPQVYEADFTVCATVAVAGQYAIGDTILISYLYELSNFTTPVVIEYRNLTTSAGAPFYRQVNGVNQIGTLPPAANFTTCPLNTVELDAVVTQNPICFVNAGVYTQYSVRLKETINNNTAAFSAPIVEFSTNGQTWSATVPTGTATLGACSDVPRTRVNTLAATTGTTVISAGYNSLSALSNGTANTIQVGAGAIIPVVNGYVYNVATNLAGETFTNAVSLVGTWIVSDVR